MARLVWLSVFALTALWACGKSNGGSGPVPFSEVPARAAAIACDGLASCCQSSGHPFDLETCKRLYTTEIEGELSRFDMSRLEYDAAMAGKCLDSFAAESRCGDLEGDDRYCERIFRGRLAPGQRCTSSEECREETGQVVSCYSSDGAEPAVCTVMDQLGVLPHGKLGDACLASCDEDDECLGRDYLDPLEPESLEARACYEADGLWCDEGACAALLEVGEPCPNGGCQPGTFCTFDTPRCSLPLDDGEPCQGHGDCRSGFCERDSAELVSSVCAPADTVDAEDCSLDEVAN